MSTALLRPGDEVERLIILEELGRGARGVIYKAYDPRLDRTVALKLLQDHPDDHAHERGRKRLVKEAQAMAQLPHPNVVTIHDVGTVSLEGRVRVYIEMEYVRGRSLAQQIERWTSEPTRSRSARWREILDPFLQAGEGLAAAHDHQLVHRDFKPANVLVDEDGRALVTDFGLVRRAGEANDATPSGTGGSALDIPLTQTGALVGTPAYMAPEQLAGQPGDARSDQFAFCVALYEALYGQRPFAGDDVGQLARALLEDDPRPPRAGANAVPAFVQRALLRGLRSEPDERHPSMRALLDRLRADPRIRVRRGLGLLGLVGGGVAFALALRAWLEPGVLALSIEGSSGPPASVRISIDGEPVQRPEQSTFELAAGVHRIRVDAPDHDPIEDLVEIRRGEVQPLSVVLEHQIGILDLAVHPQGARLRLDDLERGSSLEGLELDTGAHELWVSAPGRHEARLEFELTVNENVELTAHLAPGIMFERRGGGLPLGRGLLGDADGDGFPDVWEHSYTTLSAYSPIDDRLLWRTNLSVDVGAQFLVMADLDADGVRDPIVAGVDASGAVLRALDGRHGDREPRWTASLDPTNRRDAPLVPPAVAEVGGLPVVLATSLERDTVAAYDGRTGIERWRQTIEGTGFGLVTGVDPKGAWVAVAHIGGVTSFEVDTGRIRWQHPVESFDSDLIDRLQADRRLAYQGRDGARSWMISTPLDDDPGDDLLLTKLQGTKGGPLLALGGRHGDERWTGPPVELFLDDLGDLDRDGRDDLVATRLSPREDVRIVLDVRSGAVLEEFERGLQLGSWPCGGPLHLFGTDEQGVHVRRVGSPTRSYPFELDEAIEVRCADWDGDGDDDVVLSTHRSGLRAYAVANDGAVTHLGAIAVPQQIDDVVPVGDIDGDARAEFLLEAGGPMVVRSSRVRWARSYPSGLRAAPVVDDFDGEGSPDVAVFNGFLPQSSLEQLGAADGRRVHLAPSGQFSLRAPTVVRGLRPGTKDLLFSAPSGSVVRVRGDDFSAHPLHIGPELQTYAGVAASADGRTLWITAWDEGPHLRALTAPPGAWVPGSPTSATNSEPWHQLFALQGEFGGWPRPRRLDLDGDASREVVATLDRGRLVVVDPESGACWWSRWVSPTLVRHGPGIVDLDADGLFEFLAASSPDAPRLAPSCDAPGAAPLATPDLVALRGQDGAILWRLPNGGSPHAAPVGVRDGADRFIVGTSETLGLYAVETDGSMRWALPLSDPVSTPLAVGDVDGHAPPEIAFGTQSGALQVHDATTGALRWRWSPPDPSSQEAPPVLADLDGDGVHEVLLATPGGILFALEGSFAQTNAPPNNPP